MFKGKEFFKEKNVMGIQASAGEACRSTENSSNMKFLPFWGNNFGLLGSGSTNSFESGSNQDPDPKHDHGSSLGLDPAPLLSVITHSQE
jgi:hypothetical protein